MTDFNSSSIRWVIKNTNSTYENLSESHDQNFIYRVVIQCSLNKKPKENKQSRISNDGPSNARCTSSLYIVPTYQGTISNSQSVHSTYSEPSSNNTIVHIDERQSDLATRL